MAKVNKGIVSPVIKADRGFLFHAGGQNFKMTGSHIEKVTNASEDFKALVKANEMFTITNEGISFYYDYNNKKTISKVEESALAHFEKMVVLNEKIDFLKQSAKSYRVAGKTNAVSKIETELAVLESEKALALTHPIAIKFSYKVSENKFYAGNVELAFSTSLPLVESLLAAAYVRYEDKALINLFEFAAKNYNHYNILEFISESRDGDVRVLAMRAESNVFVYRINESTKIEKFSKLLADAAIEYVAENTGADITPMVEDILESYKERRAAKMQNIQLMYEMIAFLKDQKGRLAEANRNLPDIKAADHLLNSEIARISEELNSLQNEDLLTRDDGYVNAEVTVEEGDIPTGTKVKVDALEFTGKGKSDILTVFVNDQPMRIEKNKLQISAEDSI